MGGLAGSSGSAYQAQLSSRYDFRRGVLLGIEGYDLVKVILLLDVSA